MSWLKKLSTAIIVILLQGIVRAEDVSKKQWHFSPYLWLPSIDVTSTIDGISEDIDLGFDDIWDNFDVFAISARGEYWWGEWGLVADGIYIDIETDDLGPMGNAELQITDGMLDILAAYRFNLTEDIAGPSMRLMAGGRYRYIKQEVRKVPLVGSLGGSEDYVEPLVGAQLLAPFAEDWLLTARGDIGGFGVGAASDLSWTAMSGVGWSFTENWMAKLGYRYEYVDYSRGSGANEFALDGNFQGPWLGIAYGM